jgi:hypothetical protein
MSMTIERDRIARELARWLAGALDDMFTAAPGELADAVELAGIGHGGGTARTAAVSAAWGDARESTPLTLRAGSVELALRIWPHAWPDARIEGVARIAGVDPSLAPVLTLEREHVAALTAVPVVAAALADFDRELARVLRQIDDMSAAAS